MKLGMGLGISSKKSLETFAKLVKDAGGVLYLDARKASGIGKLTGNEQWFHDLSDSLTEYIINNKVTNGDFGDGITGWSGAGAALSVINNIMSVAGNGTNSQIQTITSIGNVVAGEKWVLYSTDKVTDSVAEKLDMYLFTTATQIVSQQLTPTPDVEYDLYGIVTIAGNASANLAIRTIYADAATANGKVMEVSGGAGVFAINMTADGLKTISAEEMITFLSDGYFETKEIQRANNGTLNNFSGTVFSGWQDSPPLLRFEGVDDYETQADTASLDIISAPLTLAHTFYIPTGASDGWLRARDNVNIQYGLFFNSATSEIEFWLENIKRASVSINLDEWNNVIFFWDGTNINPVLNNVNQSTVGFIGTLTSQTNNYSGRRTSGQYLGYDKATESIYTGNDFSKIKKAEARISAEYLASNP